VEQLLGYAKFGADNGRIVIYFHGAPGAPEECRIFEREGKKSGLIFICFDRFSIDSSITGESYYRLLAGEISKLAAGKPVDVIGFSIGAFVALQTCRYLPRGVRNLHLVSSAAPLEAGDYLEVMAGKQVFKLARTFPVLFILLSYWQGVIALLFPNALFRMLFASAAAEDKALTADREFRSGITRVLRSCFMGRVRGYARDIGAYVRPWDATLSANTVNTHIWHGAEDNWSPVAMAGYLESAIPGCTPAKIYGGQSHYSCLYRAVPEICNQIGMETIK
jgi:pimeloyl-ACP methyl ester carboxylesterase